MEIKSCRNCRNCCPRNGYPCNIWEMFSDEESEEKLAKDCNDYSPVTPQEPEVERYYSPLEVYSMKELI